MLRRPSFRFVVASLFPLPPNVNVLPNMRQEPLLECLIYVLGDDPRGDVQ